MGFSIYYLSTRPVNRMEAEALDRAARVASRGHTWLACEPIYFFHGQKDGHLRGASKLNFQPHPDDAAAAARSGLPVGTVWDMLDVLCNLSLDHGVGWEFSHDADHGPIGYIRAGVCDEDLLAQVEGLEIIRGCHGPRIRRLTGDRVV